MKKRRNDLIQLSILVVLGAAVLLSLVLPQLPGGEREVELLELSVIFREADASLWSNTRLGMEQAAGDLGAELRFLTLSRTGDSAGQAELLRREAEGGADALIVVPADPEGLGPGLAEAAAGRPVVSLESPLAGAGLVVAPDNEALGRQLAEAALADWTGGTVLLLDTAGESAGVAARLDGAEAALTAAGVPVIFFNRQPVAEDIQRWERIYYVGARAEEGGTLQGRLVLEAWQSDRDRWDRNGDGVVQYAMLEGEPGHQDALLRTEYAVKALTGAGVEVEKLSGDTANWNRGQAEAKMQQWLEKYGSEIEVVLANNDDMALGPLTPSGRRGWSCPWW